MSNLSYMEEFQPFYTYASSTGGWTSSSVFLHKRQPLLKIEVILQIIEHAQKFFSQDILRRQ